MRLLTQALHRAACARSAGASGTRIEQQSFEELADRLRANNIEFVIEPHLRFAGEPGEQYTMFFKDPSGNNLEFKAMGKYNEQLSLSKSLD